MKQSFIGRLSVIVIVTVITACSAHQRPATETAVGTAVGAGVGAGVGTIAGNNISGFSRAEGAVAGALIGGLIGVVAGNQQAQINSQQRQINTLSQQANQTIVNVTNSNGSITPVILTRHGSQWRGPRGELYNTLPAPAQLKSVYGF